MSIGEYVTLQDIINAVGQDKLHYKLTLGMFINDLNIGFLQRDVTSFDIGYSNEEIVLS